MRLRECVLQLAVLHAGDAELLPLVGWLQSQLTSASLAFQARQRLSLALAALAVHLCRSHWTTCVEVR
eukprot:4963280-Amphidinium_carterae.1